MLRLRRLLMLGLAGVVLVGPPAYDRWDFEIAVPYGDADDPFTDAALRARMERIAPLVAEVVGSPLDVRDVHIASGDSDVAAERHLYEAFPTLSDLASETHAARLLPMTRTAIGLVWSSRLAAYSSESKSIEVFAHAIETFQPSELDGILDIVLAHELTHLWQDRAFQAFHQEGASTSSETELARTAAIEGSAEFVSREVARRLGVEAVYARLNERRGAEGEDPLSDRLWPYLEGLRFVEAVHGRLGTAETWRRLFRDPPRCVWDVEHPLEWVAGPSEGAEALEHWAERLGWCMALPPTDKLEFKGRWVSDALLRKDQEERLRRAGLEVGAGPWAGCRGGLRLMGAPLLGALADTGVRLDAWRFERPEQALEAYRSLETAQAERGLEAWPGGSSGAAGMAAGGLISFLGGLGIDVPEGPSDSTFEAISGRRGPEGSSLYRALTWGARAREAREGSWALTTHGSVLLETTCWRRGAGPALLEVLETAVRAWVEAEAVDGARAGAPATSGPWGRLAALRTAARAGEPAPASLLALPEDEELPAPLRDELLARRLVQPRGEEAVLAWLQERPREAGTWIAALGPAAGHEEVDGVDRGALLGAALQHPDDDVRRFALGVVGDGRFRPAPLRPELLIPMEAASRDGSPATRVAAVLVAEMLHEEELLTPARVDTLLRDASPAVRLTLTDCEDLLGDRRSALLAVLAADVHPEVRRAAHAVIAKQEKPSSTILAAIGASGASDDKHRQRDRVGRELDDANDFTRGFAYLALQHTPEIREQFLPRLVRALGDPQLRELVVPTLLGPGLELEPARRHLLRMLEHPRVRPSALRVLAAHPLSLPPSVAERARGWSETGDVQLRCAAALLRLRLDPEDESSLAILEEVWSDVPLGWRPSILLATVARHRDTEMTRRLRRRALASPFWELRNAGREDAGPQPEEDHLDALLSAVPRVGPTAAAECWKAFLEAADGLDAEGRLRVAELLAGHLNRWCDADRPPLLGEEAIQGWARPDFSASRACFEAIDRCLVREGSSYLQLSLTLLRSEQEDGQNTESVEVHAALDRLLTLDPRPAGFPRYEKMDFFRILAKRPDVSTELLLQVLRREASEPYEELALHVSVLLAGKDERIDAALQLVPELLERGTRSSVQIAVEILEAARARAAPLLPRVRELLPRALPSWRKRLEEIVRALEAPPGTPWPEKPKPKKR